MRERPLSFYLRRVAAGLTTPLVVGLFWGLLLGENRSAENIWGAIGLCYIVWLLMGVPGLFSRSRTIWPGWAYPVVGATTAMLFTFPFGGSGITWPLTTATTGAAAGAWYWLCAYWQPGRLSDARQPPSS
jgi:hypothetical protein